MTSSETVKVPTIEVSRETRERFQIFLRLLREWQNRINLVASSTLADAETRHITDSLQLAVLLRDQWRVVDMGSGAGFPGLVLAMVLDERNIGEVHLIESSSKKCAFLRTVSRETGLGSRCVIHNDRVEHVVEQISAPHIVTARALAPLSQLLGLAEPWMTQGSRGLFPKGREFHGEVEEAGKLWDMRYDIHQSQIEADSVILEISDLRKR